jgi:hypothetical protein
MDSRFLLFFTLINQIIIALNIKFFQKIYEDLSINDDLKKNYTNAETFYSIFSILSWICLLFNIWNILIIPLILFNLYPFKKFGWIGYLFSAIVNIVYITIFIVAEIFKFNLFNFVYG